MATFEVRQSLRYEYPGPIEDLHQVLLLVPPNLRAGQTLLSHELAVVPSATPRYSDDRFGNRVCSISMSHVENSASFTVTLRVERRHPAAPAPAADGDVRTFSLPSPLVEASRELEAAARALAATGAAGLALAERINAWVHERLRYQAGVTGIETTAADALAHGEGVCQDFAHVMIAICRLCGLPARYISGHLLGEGAMHAWVEVLTPEGDAQVWRAFDPTHGVAAGLPYITVAAGRDYGDVSPTRGTFRAPYAGRQAASNREAGVLAIA